jgi:dynactin complex subunit
MPKKCNFLQPQSTLTEFGGELMVPKSLQNNVEMSHMLFFTLGINQNVNNKDNNKLVQLRHEYRVHQVHEMCRSIGESKQHNQILIQPIPGGESGLRNVFQMDLDLMITRTKIDRGKYFGTAS